VGDEHHHVPFAAVDAAHAHHDDVIEAHHRDVEAEELVLGIAGDGGGGARPKKLIFLDWVRISTQRLMAEMSRLFLAASRQAMVDSKILAV
jgi:hypothetical protein